MRSSIIVGSFLAALAVASPVHKAVHKKDLVYDITTEIVYVTVTEGEPLPTSTTQAPEVTTPSSSSSADHSYSHTESSSSSTSIYTSVPMTTSTPPPVPTTISIPPPPPTTSTTPAPAPTISTEAAPVVATPATQVVNNVAAASPTNYQSTAIYHHNQHRANHSAGALEWDDTLAGYALKTAQTCVFKHDMTEGGGGYGQNLAAYGTTTNIASLDTATLVADAVTNQWYYGEAANVPYGQDSPNTSGPEFLHFTALIWKTSTKVGCATVQCGSGTIFAMPSLYTVCDYSTEGNVLGAFTSNVVKPIGLPGITATIS